MNAKIIIGISLFLFISAAAVQGQRGYTDFKTEDNIKVTYRWHNVSPFNKDSDAVLNLRVTNENETAVKWTFSVIFYNDNLGVFESETTEMCIKAGQSLRGGLAGLRFTYDGLKLDEVNKDSFSWDFEIFDVEEVENCN